MMATILRAPCPVMLMCRELGAGGSERQLTQLALHLDPARYQVHVGSFRPSGMRAADLRTAGISVCDVAIPSYRSPALVTAGLDFARYLRRTGIRIVHTFDIPVSVFAVPVARLARVPVVLSSQRGHRALTRDWPRHVLKLLDLLVDGVVVNCEAMRTHMVEQGIRPDRLYLVHNGIDTGHFTPAPARASSCDGVVVGTVSVLRPVKDLVTLVRAFHVALRQHPRMRLLIVGAGPERGTLERVAGELGVRDRVEFPGDAPDVVPWLHQIDIFVLPSVSEALSNSLMEAMACGCCCVASAVGGNPELIDDGVSGRLFTPGSHEELATILVALADRVDVRRSFSEAAVRAVSTRFDMDVAAGTLARHYDAALARKGIQTRSAEGQSIT